MLSLPQILVALTALAGPSLAQIQVENEINVLYPTTNPYYDWYEPLASATPMTHVVQVGMEDQLLFNPSQVQASVMDVVVFQFHRLNHSVTESSLQTPCQRASGGFDSGFGNFDPSDTGNNFVAFNVKDDSPRWFFCAQTDPLSHCNAGMVFGLNPGNLMNDFLSAAQSPISPASGNALNQTLSLPDPGMLPDNGTNQSLSLPDPGLWPSLDNSTNSTPGLQSPSAWSLTNQTNQTFGFPDPNNLPPFANSTNQTNQTFNFPPFSNNTNQTSQTPDLLSSNSLPPLGDDTNQPTSTGNTTNQTLGLPDSNNLPPLGNDTSQPLLINSTRLPLGLTYINISSSSTSSSSETWLNTLLSVSIGQQSATVVLDPPITAPTATETGDASGASVSSTITGSLQVKVFNGDANTVRRYAVCTWMLLVLFTAVLLFT